MAELADALDLGSSAREGVGVQVSPGARRISEMRTRFSDLVFPIGEIQLPLRQPVVPFAVGPPTSCLGCLRWAPPVRARALPTRPAPVPPAAAPANPYSTTPFLNAQITSCTRLCVPVFAMADDRWVFTVDGSKNRVAAISLLLIP